MLQVITRTLALMASVGLISQVQASDLLTRTYPPAFEAFQAVAQQGDTGWQIDVRVLDGYYLYVDDFQPEINAGQAPVALDWARPAITQVNDPLRGAVDVMRGSFQTQLSQTSNGELWLNLQGCADSGFCYPPEKRLLAIISE